MRRLSGIEKRLRLGLEALRAVRAALAGTLDLTETLRRLARAAGRAAGADMVGAYLLDPEGSALRPAAGHHVPPVLLPAFRERPVPLRGHPFIEEAWRERRPVWIADTRSDPRGDRCFVETFPRASILAVPIPGPGQPMGALFCTWWQEHPRPADEAIALVQAIAAQGAIAVRNARLHASALAAAPPPPA